MTKTSFLAGTPKRWVGGVHLTAGASDDCNDEYDAPAPAGVRGDNDHVPHPRTELLIHDVLDDVRG